MKNPENFLYEETDYELHGLNALYREFKETNNNRPKKLWTIKLGYFRKLKISAQDIKITSSGALLIIIDAAKGEKIGISAQCWKKFHTPSDIELSRVY